VDVVGPAGFSTGDAIAMFEAMTQKRVNGLVVVPMPGEVWVTPIRQATQAGIPVLTANVTSPGSAATAWVGQDEFASGTILAAELRKFSGRREQAGRPDYRRHVCSRRHRPGGTLSGFSNEA
jgi:ABC-type sugar transport system substrate-binding protein